MHIQSVQKTIPQKNPWILGISWTIIATATFKHSQNRWHSRDTKPWTSDTSVGRMRKSWEEVLQPSTAELSNWYLASRLLPSCHSPYHSSCSISHGLGAPSASSSFCCIPQPQGFSGPSGPECLCSRQVQWQSLQLGSGKWNGAPHKHTVQRGAACAHGVQPGGHVACRAMSSEPQGFPCIQKFSGRGAVPL